MALYNRLDFPADDQYWMVTWVSRVALAENEFHFELQLAAVDISIFTQSFYRSVSYQRTYTTCIIGAGLFAAQAEIGSIWHRRQLIFSPTRHYTSYSGLTTHTITLSQPAQAYSQTLGELALRTENLVSFHPFPGHRHSPLPLHIRESVCLVVDSPHLSIAGRHKTAFLLIPPSELIRFYYCGSPYIFRQILQDGLPQDRIYKRRATRYNTTIQDLFVQLRKQVPDDDALIVGRLAGDSAAYWAARNIGRHLQQSFINSRTAHLVATFPFQGPTTLHVVGKPLKTLDKENEWAFFVYAIISCSSAFPFRRLLFSRDNDNTTQKDSTRPSSPTQAGQRITATPPIGASISSILPPSSGLASGQLPMDTMAPLAKFTQAPPYIRLPKEQRPATVPGKLPRWYSRPDIYTTTSTPAGDPAQAIGLVGPQQTSPTEDAPGLPYSEFRAIMLGLRQCGLTCYCVDYWSQWTQSKQFKDFYLPIYRALDTKEKKWLFVVKGMSTDLSNPTRVRKLMKRRKVVILQIVYEHTTFYLLECESGITESFSRMLLWFDQEIDLPYELNQLLIQLVRKKGIWREFPFPKYVTTRTLHHAAGETGLSVAQRVFTYMKQILNRYSATPSTQPATE